VREAGVDVDSGSGVAQIKYTTDGTDSSPVNGTIYSGAFQLASTATVKFRTYDQVGNEEAVGSQLIRIDSSAPTGSVTAPAGGATVMGSVNVSSGSADAGGLGIGFGYVRVLSLRVGDLDDDRGGGHHRSIWCRLEHERAGLGLL
jgi:hypothetical protein